MFQKITEAFRALALLFSISFVFVVTAFGLVEDSLFFQSDLKSAFVLVVALSIPLWIALTIAFVLSMLLTRRQPERAVLFLGNILATVILADVPYFFLAGLDKEFRIFDLFRKLDAEYLFIVLWAILVGGAGFLVAKASVKQNLAGRTALLASLAARIALAGFIGSVILLRAGEPLATGQTNAPPARHVVLLVLDGWPAQYMRAFNPAASPKTVDGLFDRALVFPNVRTSGAWTNAYFGTLYKGSPEFTFARIGLGKRLLGQVSGTDDNLLSVLQRLGVRTRVMTYHRNGMPEGSASVVSGYRGLRSVFLTFEHTPALDALGLDYNLVIPGGGARSIWGDQRKAFVRKLLGARNPSYGNILTELLVPQMRKMQGSTRRSFMVFHTGWKLGGISLPAAWDNGVPTGDGGRIVADARAQDHRYQPADEWYAERMRRQQDATTEQVGRKISAFIEALAEAGLLDETLLIFTADHGSMFARSRMWYGFHAEEEVLRVPFVMFGAGRSGIEERPFETMDIVQTLIDYFGGTSQLHPRARSMLSAGAKPFTSSVTLRSDRNREWLVAIYKGDRKYLLNFHPDGDGQVLELTVDGFGTSMVRKGYELPNDLIPELKAVLADFGFDERQIHPNFRTGTAGTESR